MDATVRLAALASFATCAALAACAHSKESIELRAQSEEVSAESSGTTPDASAPASSAVAAPAAPPEPAVTSPVADNVPSCPLHCVIATPRHRTLAQDEEDRLRAAFAPTMAGIRQCIYGDHYDGHRVRPPALIARFATSGDLLDVGVDDSAWGNAASCFDAVVRGSSTGPDLRVEGPATVHCVERCENAPSRARGKKK